MNIPLDLRLLHDWERNTFEHNKKDLGVIDLVRSLIAARAELNRAAHLFAALRAEAPEEMEARGAFRGAMYFLRDHPAGELPAVIPSSLKQD